MSVIHVCSLARLHDTVRDHGARHVATLINAGTEVVRPREVAERDHLFIGMNDINRDMPGYTAPAEAHLTRFMSFVEDWAADHTTPLVIHCWAGVSRSTAAAFVATAMLRPDWEEARIARLIRARSPSATPNPLIIALADDMLGRNGRMLAALDGIGRGADCYEGTPFSIRLDERP